MSEDGVAAVLTAFGIAALSSVDNLSLGFGYALKSERIGMGANALVALINSSGMMAMMFVGQNLVRVMPSSLGSPDRVGSIMAGILYIGIGVVEATRLVSVYRLRVSAGRRRQMAHDEEETDEESFANAVSSANAESCADAAKAGSFTNVGSPTNTESPTNSESFGNAGSSANDESFSNEESSFSNEESSPVSSSLDAETTEVEGPSCDDAASADLLLLWLPKTKIMSSSAKEPSTPPVEPAPTTLSSVAVSAALQRRASIVWRAPGVVRNFMVIAWLCGMDVVLSRRLRPRKEDTRAAESPFKMTMKYREALIVGLALTGSNIAAGIGAGAVGMNPFLTTLATFACSFIFMAVGQHLGIAVRRGAAMRCDLSNNQASVASALIFFVLGIIMIAA